jgi:hypothetical protein
LIQFKPMTEQIEWLFFKEKTHVLWCEDSQGVVAYDDRGIQAMAVCDTWTPDACNIHYCLPNPLAIRSGFFNQVFNHVFNVCGRSHIFGLVPSNNAKAIKLAHHFGMEDVTTIPDAVGKSVDIIVMRMNKEDCRWIDQPVKEERAA